eukprot:g4480.t1
MALTSTEVNYLVYRYLQESGFKHSAYTFASESMICKTDFTSSDVPPGALVTFLQKGLMYTELEAHAKEDGTEKNCDEPFSLIRPHRCKVKVKKETAILSEMHREIRANDVYALAGPQAEVFQVQWSPKADKILTVGNDAKVNLWDIPDGRCSALGSDTVSNTQVSYDHKVINETKGKDCALVRYGEGEKPIKTAMLSNEKKKELSKSGVTCGEWHPDGVRIATASYDGNMCIWSTSSSEILHMFNDPKILNNSKSSTKSPLGPIFSLAWNPKGTLLASVGVAGRLCVFSARTGELKQYWECHNGRACLDVTWRDNLHLASCGADSSIVFYQVGVKAPLEVWKGHKNEINSIRWDPTGTMLASGADDSLACVWKPKTNGVRFRTFKGHTEQIFVVRWCPKKFMTDYGESSILATAAYDGTVRLWDVQGDQCMHVLSRHNKPVYSIDFSPDGDFLASGSADKKVAVSQVKTGKTVRTYTGEAGIYSVSWNDAGDKIATGGFCGPVYVFDFIRKMV